MTSPTRLQPGGFVWSDALARYRDARTGRIVSTASVRDAIDATLIAYKDEARALAESLRAGTVTLKAWEAAMRVVVKDAQLLGVASAAGGWAQLDQTSLGRAGRLIRDQYGFLNQFAVDISTGKQALTAGIASRAVMYVEASRGSYEAQREVLERAAGYDEEISIRHASDSCNGCVGEAARGWVPIGHIVPIGDRDCLTRCQCTIERRISEPQPRTRPRRPAAAASA